MRGTAQHLRRQPALGRGDAQRKAVVLWQYPQPYGVVSCTAPLQHGSIATNVQAEPFDEKRGRTAFQQLAHTRLVRRRQVKETRQHRTHQGQALLQRHGTEHLAVGRAARQAKRQPRALLKVQGRKP
ncbi:hypothetical protein D3C80_1760560 [compost metagenome]